MAEDTQADAQDTFISHLVELRNRLVRAVAVVLAVFLLLVAVWPGPGAVYDFIARPMMIALPGDAHMIATGVITPFMVPMKVTLLAAFIISLPWVLYQAWAFVAPGLYAHEKKLVLPLVVASTGLFVSGIAFCYFFVFGVVFSFVNRIAPKSISVAPDIEQYLNFVLTMFLAFGVTFEVPIAVILLARMGVVSLEQLKSIRPYFVVGAFVVAAVVTPPDVVSQLLLAIPMCLLYELGLFMARFFVKSREEQDDYRSPSDAAVDRELDRIDAERK